MSEPATRVTYVLVARIPPDGAEVFDAYERAVLPLLADHGGALERRLASDDRLTEVHLVSFSSPAAFDAYRDDSRRVAQAELLERSRATVELVPGLRDLTP